MQRIFGLTLADEGPDDHDRLRDDGVPALAVAGDDVTGEGRERECNRGHPMASPSMLIRMGINDLETAEGVRYKRNVAWPERFDELLVRMSLCMYGLASRPAGRRPAPPEAVVPAIDATHAALHGNQEGGFFNGHHKDRCHLPLHVFCNGHPLPSVYHRLRQTLP